MKSSASPPSRVLEHELDSELDELEPSLRQGHELPAFEPTPSAAVGECLDDTHPTLAGRVKVRWTIGLQARESWLPTLQGLSIRRLDRVLLTFACNASQPIVTGVVDGFARRPEVEKRDAQAIRMHHDERLTIVGADGRPLLEVHQSSEGSVLRLHRPDLELETPGRLRIRAKSLDLQATQGKVNIESSDDVIVRGETVRLN